MKKLSIGLWSLAAILAVGLAGLCATHPEAVEQSLSPVKPLKVVSSRFLLEPVEFEPQKAKHKHGRGYKPLSPEKKKYYQAQSRMQHGDRITRAAKNLFLSASFDCRVQFPLPNWDQGQCGSCYLCSTVRTMTNAGLMIGAGKPDDSYKLSMQFGMDYPRSFGGCDGGNGTDVIDWACKNGWIAEKYIDSAGTVINDYPPYEAQSGSDRTKPGARVWVKGWTWGFVNANGNPTVDEIKAAMFLHGRLNVSLDAGGQFGDGTDTITSLGTSIDHEINMIAWDDNKDGGAFLLENQWGDSWGVKGCRWVTYKAAANIANIFWVSAGVIPPPPPPIPPVTGGTPPFKLYEGVAPMFTQVGTPAGYATLAAAEGDARTIGTTDKSAVLIYDSSKPPVLIETVQPGFKTVTITLTDGQIADVLAITKSKEPPVGLKLPKGVSWFALIADLEKLAADVATDSPAIVADIQQLLIDLGIPAAKAKKLQLGK